MGTEEATVAELADGRIYYNSQRHWAPKGAKTGDGELPTWLSQ
jgi:hypothetical protein